MVPPPPDFLSVKAGDWTDPTVWSSSQVPIANANVVVRHAVTHQAATTVNAYCNNLEITNVGTLNQKNTLFIAGNLQITGTFNNNADGTATTPTLTAIGYSTTPAAGESLVTLDGNLNLGGNNTNFNLAGRMVCNNGGLVFSPLGNLRLLGWSGGTPQYLMTIDNIINLNLGTGRIQVDGGGVSALQVFSTGNNLVNNCATPNEQAVTLTGVTNAYHSFGSSSSATRQFIQSVEINPATALNTSFTNTMVKTLKTGSGVITSSNGKYGDMYLGNGATLNGDYSIEFKCNLVKPKIYLTSEFTTNNSTDLRFNVSNFNDFATINIAQTLGTKALNGLFTSQNGHIVVKGGTLDLQNATVSGLSIFNYFMTQLGDEVGYSGGVGKVRLATANNVLKRFEMGLNVASTNYYTPLSITAKSVATTNATVDVQPLTTPAGFYAPNVKWTVESVASPNMDITFTWHNQLNSANFSNNQGTAKVYRLNGASWVEVPSSIITLSGTANSLMNITVTGVTTVGTFAVMSPIPAVAPPTITAPTMGQVMDNGCDNGTVNSIEWHFQWTPVVGAIAYDLSVKGRTASFEIIYVRTTGGTGISPVYDYSGGGAIGSSFQTNWDTKVRAVFAGDVLGDWSAITTFDVEAANTDCPPILSINSGDWANASTWNLNRVPTATDAVTVSSGHTVIISSGTGNSNNLTVNGTLNQQATLIVGKDLTITGTFNHAYSLLGAASTASTQIGAVDANGVAGTRFVLVTGAISRLSLGNNQTSGGFFLAGRLFFNTGSTLDLKDNCNLTLTGWSGATPQYLITIDNLTTLTAGTLSSSGINIVKNNGTQPILSTGNNFEGLCANEVEPIGFKLAANNTYYFGLSGTQRTIKPIYLGANATLNLTNTTTKRLTAISGGTVNSTAGQFSNLSAGGGTTLNGSYTIINNCDGSATPTFSNTGSLTVANAAVFTVNVTDSATFNIPTGTVQSLNNFTIQNGKVTIKGGILDLSTATVSAFNSTYYFLTKGGAGAYLGLGGLRLATPNATAKRFDIGVGNTNPSISTTVYTPLSITANSGATTATVSAQPFTPPSSFSSPNVQWTIASAAASPNMDITFTWQSSNQSPTFAISQGTAKVYRQDGAAWIELPSSAISGTAFTGFSITATGVTTLGTFAVMSLRVPLTITSATTGNWSQTSTWVNSIVPTAIDNVFIAATHTVSVVGGGAVAECNNLTVNTNGTLNQSQELILGGNLTINGVFNHAFDLFGSGTGATTRIGVNNAASVSPGTRLVTVTGTLTMGNNLVSGGFLLAGRMLFNNGSTLDLKDNCNLTLTGWSGASPEYLMNIENLTTLTVGNNAFSGKGINVIQNNGTQPIISTGRNFTATACAFSSSPIGFNLASGENFYFGTSAAQRSVQPISLGANTNLYLTKTTTKRLTATSGGSVHSTDGQFSNLIAGGGTTLHGNYTLINDCLAAYPLEFTNTGGLSFDPAIVLNVNVGSSVDFNIPTATTQTLKGTFNIQNGRVVVKGGTLNLEMASAITGLSSTNYFTTEVGTGAYNTRGKVMFPVVPNNVTPSTFNLGVSIPNGANPPTNAFAPITVQSNTGVANNVAVTLQPLTVPVGYLAPRIQWDISPMTMPASLKITFTWPITAESAAFTANRNNARIYHWNSVTNRWDALNYSLPVLSPDGTSYSITINTITDFSPFTVMSTDPALPIDLINFSAIINDNKAELNWQTTSEIKVKNFDIEKSLNGKTFEKIAEIKANNTPSVYQTFDAQFYSSSYYRLKINDLDGTVNYSKTIFLEKNSDKTLQIIRDTEGSVLIETNDKIELITVTNSIGQLIKSTKEKRFLIEELNAGIYIIGVKTDKAFLSKKIFKN